MDNPVRVDSYKPSFEMPIDQVPGLEDLGLDDEIDGNIMFEVRSKDSGGISIRITSLSMNSKKRIV